MNDFDPSAPVPGFDRAPEPAPAGFLGEARKLSVGEAMRIIPDTLSLLFGSIGPQLGIAAVVLIAYWALAFVLGFLFARIPFLGVVVINLIVPVLMWLVFYGWYRLIHKRETEGPVDFMRLFDGFTDDPLRLAGGILAIWFASMLIMLVLGVVALVLFVPGVFSGEMPAYAIMALLMMKSPVTFFLLFFVGMLALSPLMSIQGSYLAIAGVGRVDAWTAIPVAVRATLRNWLPIMVVNAVTMFLAILASLFIGFVVGGIGGLLRSQIVGMIIAFPAMAFGLAVYTNYGYALFKRMLFAQPDDEIEADRPSRMNTVAPPPEAFAPPPVDHDAPWTLTLLRALDPVRFGALCSTYFSTAGFHVEARHGLTDGSARFVLAAMSAPDRPMMFVETVAWGTAVDLPRMRDFRDAITRNQLQRGTIIAASGFTEDALKDAVANKIRAIDGAELLTLIIKLPPDKQAGLRDAAFPPPAA